ncbi:hypothetical protein OEZ85_004330 [Tetradesmus obliquus]|uniref:C2CD3 N-terminal C2 domain-containing protein n=1 Tax=Tetradesmus obliquus TaxID=3088 RepID=A0ABY8UL52_TETOB|nr:hypothetical protein OEZ85_004330 [Tetradesmus obliquus]
MKDPSTPHVKIASLTLPPDVPGEVQLRLRWWGASADTVVPFHATRGAGAAFPLTSGPRYLSRYLKDMGCAVLTVEECPSSRPVGTISVDVSCLDVSKPVEASVPLKGSNGQVLATAAVSMRVHYGEEPLFTQEVQLIARPEFSAHAQHTVLLPPGQSLADCLADDGSGAAAEQQLGFESLADCLADDGSGAAADQQLGFEVYNKWQDDSDSLIAAGVLPLQQVLALSQVYNKWQDDSLIAAGVLQLQQVLALSQAAVRDAENCLGGGSDLLGRALQLGPHPYATLGLPAALVGSSSSSSSSGEQVQAVQVLKTPFQAQTFCPQFHHKQLLPLTLTGPSLAALASAECSVQLWHHCPRSQAVAAALSRGHSSSYVMAGQQQVLLGSGSCPLQALLTRPQGIRSWLVLKSQLGQPVGAVQVALQFTHIGGTPTDTCPAADCPLNKHPQLLQLLATALPAAAPTLTPLLASPPEGFAGQLARLSVLVEELLLPGGDDVLLERPRIANYVAAYRLPGAQAESRSHSKAPTSPQHSILLARLPVLG